MINKIKNDLMRYLGKSIRFRYNGSRNQIDEFDGIITNCYNYIFTIKTDSFVKSFSYSDILTGILEINI